MHDLVAATDFSGPADSASSVSAISASGDVSSFTSATTSAPALACASTVASRSGLRPDCEIAMHNARRVDTGASNSDTTDGAADATGTPTIVSIRYLP